MIFCLVILSVILWRGVQAQSPADPSQKAPIPQAPSIFDLDAIFGQIDELFNSDALKMLEEEFGSTRDIWGKYVDPSCMDSTMMRLNDPIFGESLDALMQHFRQGFQDENGIGGLFENFLKDLPLNGLPFPMPSDSLKSVPKGQGWEIIPNVPQPKEKAAEQKTEI
jgi:hypothetical protein